MRKTPFPVIDGRYSKIKKKGSHEGGQSFAFLSVGLPAGRTDQISVQFFTAGADITAYTGGIAVNKGVVGHVARDDRTCADKGITSDGDAAYDGGIGSDGSPALHQCRAGLIHTAYGGARVPYVGEYHGGAAEHFIFQRYMAIYADIILNFAGVADAHMGIHIDILSYITSGSDNGRSHDVAEMPDMRAFADACAFVDDAAGVDEAFQGVLPEYVTSEYRLDLFPPALWNGMSDQAAAFCTSENRLQHERSGSLLFILQTLLPERRPLLAAVLP